jgi:hypothetical protein
MMQEGVFSESKIRPDLKPLRMYNGILYVEEYRDAAIRKLKTRFLFELPKAKKQVSCFISYSRRDNEYAEHLAQNLRLHGAKTWRDSENIPANVNWDREIEKAIRNCTM